MNLDFHQILATIGVGIGATLTMDLWTSFLKVFWNVPAPNYCLVGRWLCHMPEGVYRHAKIEASTQKPHECVVGWITHYLVGVIYALLLVFLATPQWLQAPTLLPAMVFGISTLVFPFFVMQPAFGSGIAASRTPKPNLARFRSLTIHAVFGFGLYISALLIAAS